MGFQKRVPVYSWLYKVFASLLVLWVITRFDFTSKCWVWHLISFLVLLVPGIAPRIKFKSARNHERSWSNGVNIKGVFVNTQHEFLNTKCLTKCLTEWDFQIIIIFNSVGKGWFSYNLSNFVYIIMFQFFFIIFVHIIFTTVRKRRKWSWTILFHNLSSFPQHEEEDRVPHYVHIICQIVFHILFI